VPYYITSNGEAAIIDPLRETQPYLERLKEIQQLKYIFETHFHADFVSGHVDLSRETGAPFLVQMLFANLTVLLQQTAGIYH
jgi:glyoxylase-like metal-dependent hydrolase (beta-lactamase superfamily II)